MSFEWLVFLVLLTPFLLTVFVSQKTSKSEFLYNDGKTDLLFSTASIVCGNIGIGSFVVVFLFAKQSPVIGFSIVIADALGLLLCALLAERIHKKARSTNTFGLIDLIAKTHEISRPLLIWLPIAIIFLLRTAIQLIALGIIMQDVFGLNSSLSIIFAAALCASYICVGGYKAATQTDLFQVVVIIVCLVILWIGIAPRSFEPQPFWDLGPYKSVLLVGIWIFLPFSQLVSINNWQRIATSTDAKIARRGFILASAISGSIMFTIAWCGYISSENSDVFAAFKGLMPSSFGWLANLMIAISIMSSIDTFIMPLITIFRAPKYTKTVLRLFIAALFILITTLSLIIGDIFETLFTAFNTLAILLPVALGSLFLPKGNPNAAYYSLNIGFFLSIIMISIDQNSAAIGGFVASLLIYLVLSRTGKQKSLGEIIV